MKKIMALLMSAVMLASCVSCTNAPEETPVVEPQLSRMKAICELAVMECYYHNVAKSKEEDAERFLFWTKDKHFWVEYSGVVELGIDASQIAMEVDGDTVTITIPQAEVLDCSVDSGSLTEDSFIVDQSSARITAEDETAAFAKAQEDMRNSAANDRVLLNSAQQRVQILLEEYINNIGSAMGKEYSIQWVVVGADGSRTTSAAL